MSLRTTVGAALSRNLAFDRRFAVALADNFAYYLENADAETVALDASDWEMTCVGTGIAEDRYRRLQSIPGAVGINRVNRHCCRHGAVIEPEACMETDRVPLQLGVRLDRAAERTERGTERRAVR